MNSKRKIRIALLCVSALVLAAWGVLMVIFFGGSKDNDKKKNNEGDDGYETIWVLKEKNTQDELRPVAEGYVRYRWDYEYEYDSLGRVTHKTDLFDGEPTKDYDLEYYYEGETPITHLTITLHYAGREGDKEEYEYYPSGEIRSSGKNWREDAGAYESQRYFDTNGWETERIRRDNDGKVVEKIRYLRDPYGLESAREVWDPETGEWSAAQDFRSECDSEGRVVKQYELDNGDWLLTREQYSLAGTVHEKVYTKLFDDEEKKMKAYIWWSVQRDRDGRLLEEWNYDSWTKEATIIVEKHVVYKYNADGGYSKTIYREYTADCEEYDREGRLLRSRSLGSDGAVYVRKQAEYDENGRILKERTSDNGIDYKEKEYRYDSSGRLIFAGSPTDESDGTYYRYDESGNLIREWDASDEEEYTSYQYEAVRLTAKQLAESRKFYTDDPGKMKRITVYRT